MTQVRHRLSDVNAEAMEGFCSVHGRVVQLYRTSPYKGELRFRCAEAMKTYMSDRYPEVSEVQRERRFLQLYGITIVQYDEMLVAQDGVCFRCKKPPQEAMRLAVDHNHTTGALRKLLCGPCNTYIGRLEANVHMLLEDLAYIDFAIPIKERLPA